MPCAIMDIGALGEGGESGLIPTPTEAAQMRQRHAARVQRPYGQTPTAIRPRYRRPSGRDTADTLAHKGLHSDVIHTSHMPRRTGWGSGTLVYALLACLGCRPWAREPGKREKQTVNVPSVQSILCLPELWSPTTAPKTVG